MTIDHTQPSSGLTALRVNICCAAMASLPLVYVESFRIREHRPGVSRFVPTFGEPSTHTDHFEGHPLIRWASRRLPGWSDESPGFCSAGHSRQGPTRGKGQRMGDIVLGVARSLRGILVRSVLRLRAPRWALSTLPSPRNDHWSPMQVDKRDIYLRPERLITPGCLAAISQTAWEHAPRGST